MYRLGKHCKLSLRNCCSMNHLDNSYTKRRPPRRRTFLGHTGCTHSRWPDRALVGRCQPYKLSTRSPWPHLACCSMCLPGTSCTWTAMRLRGGRSTCRANTRCNLMQQRLPAFGSMCLPRTSRKSPGSSPRAGQTMSRLGMPCTPCGRSSPPVRPSDPQGNSGRSPSLATPPANSTFLEGTFYKRFRSSLRAHHSKSPADSAGTRPCFHRSKSQHRKQHMSCWRASADPYLLGNFPAHPPPRGPM
mmetsp:Transcript_141081/g.351866  ORF Transcript_141081/g.351866 Transcript_141081/m.351866 type:complete len:245 (-) Transcript_141081:58-792(-)